MTEAIFGLVGVIVGSFIAIFKDLWSAYRVRRSDASYSAIRLTCILEEYASECIAVVDDDGTIPGQPESGEKYPEVQVETPDPLSFPEDIVWRSLKESLMHRILALPNLARNTDRRISVAANFLYLEEFFDARQEGYAIIGLEALAIAGELRYQYGIAAKGRAHLNTDWNPEVHLRERLKKLDEIRERRNKSSNDVL